MRGGRGDDECGLAHPDGLCASDGLDAFSAGLPFIVHPSFAVYTADGEALVVAFVFAKIPSGTEALVVFAVVWCVGWLVDLSLSEIGVSFVSDAPVVSIGAFVEEVAILPELDTE